MKNIIYLLSIVFLTACQPQQEKAAIESSNPEVLETTAQKPAFDEANSDAKAIEIADKVMEAMGGDQAWNSLRYVSWNFFGARDLIWDKHTGRVRIDFPRDSSIYLVNVETMEGKVLKNGVEVTDSLQKHLQTAKSIWINDSYWLTMPFKLKDSGVTLTYAREDSTMAGAVSDVLVLNFDGVGDTPNNKYEVFVDKADNLIKQWSYFKDAEQDSASAIWPWDNYQEYNGVLLSGDRSDRKGPQKIKVFNELPDQVFENFEAPSL